MSLVERKGKKSNMCYNSYWVLGESIEKERHWMCGSPRNLSPWHRVDLLLWWSTGKQQQCPIRVSHSERSLVPGSDTIGVSGTSTRSSCAISKRPSIVIRRTNTRRRHDVGQSYMLLCRCQHVRFRYVLLAQLSPMIMMTTNDNIDHCSMWHLFIQWHGHSIQPKDGT